MTRTDNSGETFPATISGNCPHCGRKVAAVPFMRSAVLIVKRTCRNCRAYWLVTVKPVRLAKVEGFAHFFTFEQLGRKDRGEAPRLMRKGSASA